MQVILYDKNEGNKLIVHGVYGLKKNKINYEGRSQWCWVCYRAVVNKTFPCSKFDLHAIAQEA